MGSLLYWLFGGAGAVAGALLMGGWEEFRLSDRIASAVQQEGARQIKLCDGRVAENANDMTAAAIEGLKDAQAVSNALSRTPIDQAELADLCNSDPSCRDRKVAK